MEGSSTMCRLIRNRIRGERKRPGEDGPEKVDRWERKEELGRKAREGGKRDGKV